jgi:nicotinate phosphoribosyltransferase
VCSVDAPALSGVYKLVELDDGSGPRPIAKFSEGKGTLPGPHQVHRVRAASGEPLRDVIALADEAPPTAPEGGSSSPLLSLAIRSGTRVRDRAAIAEVRARVASGLATLPPALRELTVDASATGYSVEVSAPLESLVDEVRTRVVEAG